MKTIICALLAFMSALFRSQFSLQLEIVALRHQLTVYQRTTQHPRINPGDRIFWSWLSRRWSGWWGALVFVQTRTVLAWQRKRFRDHWTKLSERGRPGRPPVCKEIRALIPKMSAANVVWGSPRTAQWTGQQIVEAFPWDTVPKYLLRDRDAIYGSQFQRRVKSMGIEEVLTAPRSPWQNAFVERLIGSIRRDCLDHVTVLNDRHLKRILTRYFHYYHRWRTHLSLEMDSPESRSVQPPALGKVVQFPEAGGLHHHYERLAA